MRAWISRFKQYLNTFGIGKKLFLSFCILFAIPILLGSWHYMKNVRQSAERDSIERNNQNARLIENDVQKNMVICKAAGDLTINTGGFLEALSLDKENVAEDMLNMRRNILPGIENIMTINLSINKVRVFITNDNLNEMYPVLRHESLIAGQGWYGSVLGAGGRPIWRLNHPEDDFIKSPANPDIVVSQYREIKFNRAHIGVIEINMDADVFFGNIYSDRIDANSFTCIVEDSGRIYWNEKSGFFNSYDLDPNDINDLLRQHLVDDEGLFFIKHGGYDLCVSHIRVAALDASICQIMSLTQLNRQLILQQLQLGSILAFFAAVYGVFVFFLIRVLTKKTRVLVSYMRKVQEGDMLVRIPDQGADEIGEISWHFRLMLNKINELIATVMQKQQLAIEAERNEKDSYRMVLTTAFNYALTDGAVASTEFHAIIGAAGELFTNPFYIAVFSMYTGDEHMPGVPGEPGEPDEPEESGEPISPHNAAHTPDFFYFNDKNGYLIYLSAKPPDYIALAAKFAVKSRDDVYCGYLEHPIVIYNFRESYKKALEALDERFASSDERVFPWRKQTNIIVLPLPESTLRKIAENIGSEGYHEARNKLLSLFDKHIIEERGAKYFIYAAEAVYSQVLQPALEYLNEAVEIENIGLANFRGLDDYVTKLCGLLDNIHETIKLRLKKINNKTAVDLALEWMENNYSNQNLNMTMAANEVSLNYSYFSIAFKERTGVSFVNYLKNLRVEKSKTLLSSGKKVYEAAKLVGYNNPTLFSQAFRDEVGISPADYRKKYK